jgi:uncharacterized phage protein gp47/JayE
MITIPTVAAIRDQIIADIEGRIGQTVPTLPKAFFRVLATALAGAIALLYRFGAWVYDQIFPQTAGAEALTRIGEQYGIVRSPSVAAILTATATGTTGTIIQAGTLWQAGGIVYRQQADAEIIAGTTTISIEAQTTGDATNQAAGSILGLVTPVAGVDTDATVASTTTTGEDAEAVETYRARIMTRLSRRPQGGASADYVTWALEVPGIVKAFAFRTAPGDVTVYPLVALSGTRIPDAGKLAEVAAYLQDTHRRPLCADVYAVAMTERTISVTVATLQPNTVEMRQAIEAAWTALMLRRFPLQYTDEVNPTNYISASDLFGEASGAGARTVEFSMYIDGTVPPITYHALANNEIAKLETVTWPA